MSSLVIVESPAKAKTINKILGSGFKVTASVGHIIDLPQKTLGVDVKNGFASEYTVIPGKDKVIKELIKAAKGAERIYLAPDPDREGEAIAYHIATQISGGDEMDKRIYRVTFNEITARAVKEAMEHPGVIDMDKVDAQQARRVLDRLVGYNLSPLLWKKIQRGLSAGRVQSVAVRLIVEREREIEAFTREEYWSITALLAAAVPPEFKARLYRLGGELMVGKADDDGKRPFLVRDEATALALAETLQKSAYRLAEVERKERKRTPFAPFITSTLQQEASKKLGFAAKKTMALAQQLYEGIELGPQGSQGLITYMRTDSVRVAREAQEWAAAFIEARFGKEYVPSSPPVYKSKASAQEAHEAIRPTYAIHTPEDVKPYLGRDLQRLYTLIWNRFIASQMKQARIEMTTLKIMAEADGREAEFRATGSIVKFPGFMALYTETVEDLGEDEEGGGGIIPDIDAGEPLALRALDPLQHFTQPPPRYTEASLVKTLEEKGIGRPSTYASTISTIIDRKYVTRDQKRFAPTELGRIVNDYLVKQFPRLIDVGFTAQMEAELDGIEGGKHKWRDVVSHFYDPFDQSLQEAAQVEGKAKPKDVETEEVCEKCGKGMVKRWGRHGWFLACSGFPKCRNAKPIEGEDNGAQARVQDQPTDQTCPKCEAPMVIKSGRFGKFIACTNYPECKTTRPIPTGVKCPEDGGDIIERRSKRGKPFWSCANYPACKYSLFQRPLPEPCPKCGSTFLVIRKEKGGDMVKACVAEGCGHSTPIEG